MRAARSVLEVLELFEAFGDEHSGEEVSQRDHSIQCAALAQRAALDDTLVAAALLHDVGHLLELRDQCGGGAVASGDTQHERFGAAWLEPFFGEQVARPILLHVVAKRWWCTVDRGAEASLSPASRHSLHLQGGLLSDDERRSFEQDPAFEAAVRLRQIDDAGKVVGLVTPPFSEFAALLEGVALR